MERLTYEKSRSRWNEGRFHTKYTSRHTFQEVVARLAAYEDTGLEPEEVKEHEAAYIEIMTRTYGTLHQKIGQWLQAEKDGRLVVLPFCVEAPLYEATGKEVREYEIEQFSMGGEYLFIHAVDKGIWYKGGRIFSQEQVGRTVFLTREEAEAALKKREED